jgi:very-short-patch-repair endonuclease
LFLRNWARLYSKPTVPEIALEKVIAQLGKPYRTQHPFFGLRRIVDFFIPSERLIIEVDGPSHKLPAQRRKDLTSSIALEKMGFAVVRILNEEVMANPAAALETVFLSIKGRPTLLELERALQDLGPAPVVQRSKRRVRKPKPGPEKVQKRQARKKGNSAEGTK